MQTPPQSPTREQAIPGAPVKKKMVPISSYKSWNHFLKKHKFAWECEPERTNTHDRTITTYGPDKICETTDPTPTFKPVDPSRTITTYEPQNL